MHLDLQNSTTTNTGGNWPVAMDTTSDLKYAEYREDIYSVRSLRISCNFKNKLHAIEKLQL